MSTPRTWRGVTAPTRGLGGRDDDLWDAEDYLEDDMEDREWEVMTVPLSSGRTGGSAGGTVVKIGGREWSRGAFHLNRTRSHA